MTRQIDPVDSIIATALSGQQFHDHLAVVAQREVRAVQQISDEADDGLTVRVTVTEGDLRFDLTRVMTDPADPDPANGEGSVPQQVDHHRGMFVRDVRAQVARRIDPLTADPVAELHEASTAIVRALLQLALMEVFDLTDPTEEDLIDGAAELDRLLTLGGTDLDGFTDTVRAATSSTPAGDRPDSSAALREIAVRELAWRIANDEELLDLDDLADFVASRLS